MTADIDFDDFNDANAVRLTVFNRIVRDDEGNVITDAPDTIVKSSPTGSAPALNAAGELTGPAEIRQRDEDTGTYEVAGKGTYYGVIAGDMTDAGDGGELVGVIVVESPDYREEQNRGTAQETGGFILYRP